MGFISWIIVGGLIGWVASIIMSTDAQQGMLLNIVVGIVGALLGGWLLAPYVGGGTINANDFSVTSLLVSLVGAVVLLAIVKLLFRGRIG
ncbi:GlsB/YeaQ/YmgE family stress response membrane protein [Oxalobacteraceae bacterium]|nr:GlsB/YeaQ/YmgE family stress response membrane protein [Oxalobacteraceae bacterium]